MTAPTSFHVFFIHDDKAGHRKQLFGLATQLEKHHGAECSWYGVNELPAPDTHPKPGLIVGAGHRTHWPVIKLAHKFKTKSCIIMSPSLPKAMFDFIITPKHDGLNDSENTFCTEGPINTVQRIRQPSGTDQTILIMLGGESKHYEWSGTQIVEQIESILRKKETTKVICFDSRRTPLDTTEALQKIEQNNFQFVCWKDSKEGELEHALTNAGYAIISPDSISMIYEALTASLPVQVFSLQPNHRFGRLSKVAKEVERLRNEGMVSDISSTVKAHDKPTPNAAQEAAQWLAQKLGLPSVKQP